MAAPIPARAGGITEAPKSSPIASLTEYLTGVREELKKAIWPTRAELYQLTKVTLVIIFLVATYCGLLDAGLTVITNWLFNNGG